MNDEFLDLSIPKSKIINKQDLSGEIKVVYEEPTLKDFSTLCAKNNIFETVDKRKNKVKLKGSQGIPQIIIDYNVIVEKSNKNAGDYPGQVFIGNDYKFYMSEKNKKGKYVWKILESI